MIYLLEWVTQETVLMRHPNMADTIRKFFSDAGSNSVRAFYDDVSGLGGYIFHVVNPKGSPDEDDAGRYYKLVTTCNVTLTLQQGSGEIGNLSRPSTSDIQRIDRQFANNEWFSGTFRGRLDRVAAVNIMDSSGDG